VSAARDLHGEAGRTWTSIRKVGELFTGSYSLGAIHREITEEGNDFWLSSQRTLAPAVNNPLTFLIS
jgi:hypothetical protein